MTETRTFSITSHRNVKITLRNHGIDCWDNVFCVFVTISPQH